MNAEALLAQYERIAEAPDAIARLRRFVLDLAVRGKLVPQEAGDEPASDLLKRIVREKTQLAKAGQIRPDKAAPLDESDAPFSLPASWCWVRLGAICAYIQRGKSPKYAVSDGAQVVSQKCVQWRGLDLSAARLITLESLASYEPIRFLREGDLVWNSTGTGTIGRVIRLVDPPDRLVCDSHVTVVRCQTADPEFIRTWLRSDHVYGVVEQRAAGSTNQVELTAQMAINQLVPLPPLAEQHRIVAKVDELMALCDQLEGARTAREATRDRLAAASLARLNTPDPETFPSDARFALDALPALTTRPDQIKHLRQTILNLAVRGKLVPQDPSDGLATDIITGIAAERDALVKRREIRNEEPVSQTVVGDAPFDLPPGWVWARLGNAVLFTQYGTSERATPSATGVPVLTMGNIQAGKVVWSNEKRIPENSDAFPALWLRKFDLLFNRTNSAELVGKVGIYLGEDNRLTFASYLIRLRPSLRWTNPEFLNFALNTSEFRRMQIVPLIKKQTGQANVNGTALKNMLVPIPPLAEQHRIVAKVNELMALCDALEKGLIAATTARTRLLDATLAEALSPALATARDIAA